MISEKPPGLRIGLVGSCQVVGLGASFQKLWPDAEVTSWHLRPGCPDSPESIAIQLARHDLVVSQVNSADPSSPLAFKNLRKRIPRAVFVPVVAFNGFHPDYIYLKARGALLGGPFQHSHSAIIAAGYVLGLPETKVARLFNALTYANLKYFDAFDVARHLLTTSFAAFGYELNKAIDGWMARPQSFMYTINHPRIVVLSELARMAAIRGGILTEDSLAPEGVDDFLSHNIQWPVYPEIARRLGLPKSDLTILVASRTHDRGPACWRKLPDMVGAFYASYALLDRALMREAVPQWMVAGLEATLAA